MADTEGGKKKRAAPKKRPVYVVLQVLDEAGNPMEVNKDSINIVLGSRDTGALLDVLESNSYPNAVYKKVQID